MCLFLHCHLYWPVKGINIYLNFAGTNCWRVFLPCRLLTLCTGFVAVALCISSLFLFVVVFVVFFFFFCAIFVFFVVVVFSAPELRCFSHHYCWIFSTHPWKGTRWCGCMFIFLNELIHASGWPDVRLEVNVFRIVCHIWRLLGQRLGSFVMHHLLLSQWMGCATHALFSGWISFFCQMDGMALFCDVV